MKHARARRLDQTATVRVDRLLALAVLAVLEWSRDLVPPEVTGLMVVVVVYLAVRRGRSTTYQHRKERHK